MAYIGKVKVSNEWATLTSLIQAQVSGQSSFDFQSGSTYSLQVDGADNGFVRLCNTSSTPTDEEAGEYMADGVFAIYEVEAGNELYVKQNGSPVYVSVSELA